ncbi:hypothetical protein [Aestuariivirga sp.]|uniref:hypothetical protein n=1 Tax=Aestuariivirga sp. TaxID=2650926 RepID=UPI003BA995C4
MTRQIAALHLSNPLWSTLGSALRQTLTSLSATPASASAFEELEGEQSRIRRSSRMWLVG